MEQPILTAIPASGTTPHRQPTRKLNPLNRVFFPGTAYWLFLLLPCIALGFWPGYWSNIAGPKHNAFQHLHNALMMVWVAVGLTQPLLIKARKTTLHRRLGKWSYILLPLVLFTGHLMMGERYHRKLAQISADVASGKVAFTPEQVQATAARSMSLGIVFFTVLAFLFLLAVVNRKKMVAHGTYMLGALLTALGPSLGRFIDAQAKAAGWKKTFFLASFTEWLVIALFLALAVYQWRKKQSPVAALVTAAVYGAAILVLVYLTKTAAWARMVDIAF